MIKCVIMAGVGTEEKALYSLKKISHHLLLKSNYLYPTKGKKKARLNDTIGDYSMGGGLIRRGLFEDVRYDYKHKQQEVKQPQHIVQSRH